MNKPVVFIRSSSAVLPGEEEVSISHEEECHAEELETLSPESPELTCRPRVA